MAIPTPLVIGTFIFIGLGILACIISAMLGVSGKNDSVGYGTWCFFMIAWRLSVTLITTATFCMWLMWALTWIAQWHPLIVPLKGEK